MIIISFEDIRRMNIAPQTCFQWVSDMIADKQSALLPAKINMKLGEKVFCNVMPCVLKDHKNGTWQGGGVKIVTRYPERIPSLDSKLLLFNAESGEFLALMDATWITAMRTGAVAAHSILLLAKKDFSTIGMMGLGNTARAALLMLAVIMPQKEFTVRLLAYKGQEISFMERFAEFPNLHFICVNDVEKLVSGADVIISAATYLSDDVCKDECFGEGVLVIPIHMRGFTNCDLFFDKVYADDYGHVSHFRYFEKFRYFAEVSDVVNGKAVGRENDKERIIVYNIGVSMHDINYATHIYQMIDKDKLADIDLCRPIEKFWI